MTAFAIMAHLSIAWSAWTVMTRMAQRLASMWTSLSWLHASLTTPIEHKIINRLKASSLWMANFLTNVTASHWNGTSLSTVWTSWVAVRFLISLFSTDTCLSNWLQARWTSSKMAFQCTHMSTIEFFLARPLASWLNLTTFDWRIHLCYTTWTE